MNTQRLIIGLIILPLVTLSQDFDTIVKAFSQKDQGNCASIAVIKAAMIHFKKDGVFQIDSSGLSHKVKLRNFDTLTLSKLNVQNWKQSAFKGEDTAHKDLADYARLCFAVMVGNYSKINDCPSHQAVKNLNGGIDTGEAFKYLGIGQSQVVFIENSRKGARQLNHFNDKKLYILYNNHHGAVASGEYYDEYSLKVPISRFKNNHRKLFRRSNRFWAYYFN